MPKPFEPIDIQINTGHIDANTGQPCSPLGSAISDMLLWKFIQDLGKDDFIYLPCHNFLPIDWPDRKPTKLVGCAESLPDDHPPTR